MGWDGDTHFAFSILSFRFLVVSFSKGKPPFSITHAHGRMYVQLSRIREGLKCSSPSAFRVWFFRVGLLGARDEVRWGMVGRYAVYVCL